MSLSSWTLLVLLPELELEPELDEEVDVLIGVES